MRTSAEAPRSDHHRRKGRDGFRRDFGGGGGGDDEAAVAEKCVKGDEKKSYK